MRLWTLRHGRQRVGVDAQPDAALPVRRCRRPRQPRRRCAVGHARRWFCRQSSADPCDDAGRRGTRRATAVYWIPSRHLSEIIRLKPDTTGVYDSAAMKKLALVLAIALSSCATQTAVPDSPELTALKQRADGVTIVRDDWGVPHIYAKTDADVVFGL